MLNRVVLPRIPAGLKNTALPPLHGAATPVAPRAMVQASCSYTENPCALALGTRMVAASKVAAHATANRRMVPSNRRDGPTESDEVTRVLQSHVRLRITMGFVNDFAAKSLTINGREA